MAVEFTGPFTETLDTIRNRMLATLRALYPDPETRPDLRQPGPMWSFLSTPAQEIELVYLDMNEVLRNAFIQYADAPYLDFLAEQNGVTRLEPTTSNGVLRFLGDIGSIVPLGTSVSTEPILIEDPVYTYDTTEAGVLVGLADPSTAPTAAEGGAGPISGDVTYKFAYVTNLNTDSTEYGYTQPSPASDPVEGLSGSEVEVTIPAITWNPASALTDISEVLVYRSYKSVADTDFSEYKYVGRLITNPKAGGVFVDDVTDSEFLLISEDIEARGGIPSLNSTGVVEVTAISQEAGLATAAPVGTIQNIDDDIPGVETATNPEDFTGGSDAESTEALRTRTLEAVRASAGAGNVDSYITWAKSIDGVYAASVTAEWYGPGTVKVVLAGANNAQITDLAKIEEVRRFIAGTIAIGDPATNPMVATPSTTGGSMLPGTYNYVVTYLNEGGGETKPSPIVSVVVPAGTTTNVVALTSIPLGPVGVIGPELCAGRRIYRSFNSDLVPRFELVTEIENNVTTTYTDTTAQTSLPAVGTPSGLSLQPKFAPKSNSTSLYDGVAPIGSHVSIETIVPLGIAVNATVVPADGYSLLGSGTTVNLTALINDSLEKYFDSLLPGQRVKFKDVENAIHDTVGVADFTDVEIAVDPYVTFVSANLAIDDDQTVDYNPLASTFTEEDVI